MKLRDKLLISFDRIWRRKIIFLINVVLGIISITLLGMVAHMYNKTTYLEKEINRITEVNSDDLLTVSINNWNLEDKTLKSRIIKFLEDIDDLASIKWSGTYIIDEKSLPYDIDGLCEIYKKYRQFGEEETLSILMDLDTLYGDRYFNTLSVDIRELKATGVILPDDIEVLEATDEYIQVLVGSELSDKFIIGNEYVIGDSKKIKVVGGLESGSRFYGTSLFENPKGSICLDGYMIFPEVYDYDEIVSSTACNNSILAYKLNQNASEEIKKAAALNGLYVEVYTLNDRLEAVLKEDDTYKDMRLLMYIMLLLSLVAFSTAGIVSIITNKNEIGIYYSCGFSTLNISGIIIIENILQLGLSMIVSVFLLYENIVNIGILDSITKSISFDIFIRYDMVLVLLSVIIVFILVTIIPVLALKKIPVSNMIGDN